MFPWWAKRTAVCPSDRPLLEAVGPCYGKWGANTAPAPCSSHGCACTNLGKESTARLISPACLAALPSPAPLMGVSSLSTSCFPWGITPVSPEKQQWVLVLGSVCVGTTASSPSCHTLPRAADMFKHTLHGDTRAQRCVLSQHSVPPLKGMIRKSCVAAAKPACPECSHQPLCRLLRQPPHTADSPNSLPPGKVEYSSTQIRS